MDEIQITSIEAREMPIIPRPGIQILASFDAQIGKILFFNCALVRTPQGIRIFTPHKNVKIRAPLRTEVKNAARAAFEALDDP